MRLKAAFGGSAKRNIFLLQWAFVISSSLAAAYSISTDSREREYGNAKSASGSSYEYLGQQEYAGQRNRDYEEDAPNYNEIDYSSEDGYYSGTPVKSYGDDKLQKSQVSSEVPSNYFPNEHFQWPASYSGSDESEQGPFSEFLAEVDEVISPLKSAEGQKTKQSENEQPNFSQFLREVGDVTSPLKPLEVRKPIPFPNNDDQNPKTAFQIADLVKNTGDVWNNAIISKGQSAGVIVGQTVQTAGEVLRTTGVTATGLIQGTGNLVSSAVQSAGNVGVSILRTKGDAITAAVRTGTALGTSALGTASSALATGTTLVRQKGDVASNIINTGGRFATGVIGTKGRLISSAINMKGQLATRIIDSNGRVAASLLNSGGDKLTQLADAINSVAVKTTTTKRPLGWGWSEPTTERPLGWGWSESTTERPLGWGLNEPPSVFSAPSGKLKKGKTETEEVAQLSEEEPPCNAQLQPPSYNQNYADSYDDSPHPYNKPQSNIKGKRNPAAKKTRSKPVTVYNLELESDDNTKTGEYDDDYENEYRAFYPSQTKSKPHANYYSYSQDQW